jgi:hypothetical protein
MAKGSTAIDAEHLGGLAELALDGKLMLSHDVNRDHLERLVGLARAPDL